MHAKTQKRWIAGLLAFLLPGAGHIYLGRYGRGLTIMLAVLLDLSALVRFSDATSGSRALLLLYLGLALPALYFISVFDALQVATRLRTMRSGSDSAIPLESGFAFRHSLILVIGGALLFFLIRPTRAVQPRLDWIGDMASGVILLLAALWLALRLRSDRFRFGRISSAVVLAASGLLLIWDQAAGRNDMDLLSEWWPLLFVLAGIEMMVYQLLERRNPGRRLTAAVGPVLATILLTGLAYSVTQYGGLPFRWLDQYGSGARMENLSEEKGFSYKLDNATIRIEDIFQDMIIDNPNGDVTIVPSVDPDGREVTVESVLWIDTDNEEEAELVRQKSSVSLSAEGKLQIATKGMPYGANGSRMPRFNLRITLPADLEALWSADAAASNVAFPPSPTVGAEANPSNTPAGTPAANTMSSSSPGATSPPPSAPPAADPVKLLLNAANGNINITGIRATGGISIRNRSGSIEAAQLTGLLEASTFNGELKIRQINGDAVLSAKEGAITASSVHGKLTASTANGNLAIEDIRGDALLETKNGFIHVRQASGSIQADTLNGEISLASSVVGGNWTINSSIGEILLSLPADGSFVLDGSVTFGTIVSELPLEVEKKTVRGQIGLGTYRIRVDANSDIRISSYPNG